MTEIMPPSRPDTYADRALDCEMGIEPAFQTLIQQAQAAGWSEDEVAVALMKLAAANMKGMMEDRKTTATIVTERNSRQ